MTLLGPCHEQVSEAKNSPTPLAIFRLDMSPSLSDANTAGQC